VAGLGVGGTPSDVFAAVLKSRSVGEGVSERCNLSSQYRTQSTERILRKLAGQTLINVTPEGMIKVAVETRSRELSARITNAYVEELDQFNRQTNKTRGRRTREFIEKRLAENRTALAKAEEDLKVFQQQNKTVSLPDETKAAIEAAATLKAEIISREVQLGVLTGYATENNPQVLRLKSEIAQLSLQLQRMERGTAGGSSGVGFAVPFSRLPAVGLELARLMREVKIQEEIFGLLTQQYETAKIAETRDTPTVQVLDRATPPEFKSRPRRLTIWIAAFIFSIFSGVFMAFILEYSRRLQEREDEYREWQGMAQELNKDLAAFKRAIFRRGRRPSKPPRSD
jgi:uncharacterized protein involved in exopolysaccharide biosynthesis